MARFKKRSKSRSSGGFMKKFSRRSKSRSSVGGSNKLIHVDAMIYGGLRGIVASKITPYLNNLSPNTAQYNDNIAMAVASYAAAKYGNGMIKQVGQKGLIIENALIAADLANNIIPAAVSGASKPQSGFIYG